MATTSSMRRVCATDLSRPFGSRFSSDCRSWKSKPAFSNLPQRNKDRWGQGLTADKMAECRWLRPHLVAQIEYADWTDVNHLRHSKFIALRDDKPAKHVKREQPVG
jgi:ATP-dependent DNA ligase